MASFIKFQGSSKDRLELHESVTKAIEISHCHYGTCFSIKRKPTVFTSQDTIFIARIVKHPNDYALFGIANPIEYDHNRDKATLKDIAVLPWKEKWPCVLRLKNSLFIQGRLKDCVLMSQLLEMFGARSFVRSNNRLVKGEKNINPKLFFCNQAFIELTDEASKWLSQKFNQAIHNHGQISDFYLKALPRPEIDINQ